MALTESSYFVSDTGKVELQTRFISLPSMLRLIIRLAEQIAAEIKVDFSGHDWQNFRHAISVRHRITHPKKRSDLEISDNDVQTVRAAFYWLLETLVNVMAAMNDESSKFLDDVTMFTALLIAENPMALALYEEGKHKFGQ
jgi:hypothetical protein